MAEPQDLMGPLRESLGLPRESRRTCLMCSEPGTVGVYIDTDDRTPRHHVCDEHALDVPTTQLRNRHTERLAQVIEKGVRSG